MMTAPDHPVPLAEGFHAHGSLRPVPGPERCGHLVLRARCAAGWIHCVPRRDAATVRLKRFTSFNPEPTASYTGR